jgi:hypothetical protein
VRWIPRIQFAREKSPIPAEVRPRLFGWFSRQGTCDGESMQFAGKTIPAELLDGSFGALKITALTVG